VCIVTAAAIYLLIFMPWRPYSQESMAQIEKSFCGSVSPGAASNEIIAFLDKKKIRHAGPWRANRVLYAYLGNTCATVIFECATKVEFQLDSFDQLTSCKADQAVTGP
jgi:hypothetical protein